MCGSTKYFRASTSSKNSAEPTGFGECRMLHGRASQYSRTASTDFGVAVLATELAPARALSSRAEGCSEGGHIERLAPGIENCPSVRRIRSIAWDGLRHRA